MSCKYIEDYSKEKLNGVKSVGEKANGKRFE